MPSSLHGAGNGADCTHVARSIRSSDGSPVFARTARRSTGEVANYRLKFFARLGPFLFCAALGACQTANLGTVQRSTYLPNRGVAVHLDAQQRLVLTSRDGTYCAEPSPDAFAVYAASLGLGASDPNVGALSTAAALGGAGASIGLRTQSITLMRDALYRLCEARANGTLSPVSGAMLLARSQDLTAVVVAVEQLTGAVAASQAALTATGNSSASAQVVANQQLLDAAREDEQAKIRARDEARRIRDEKALVITVKTREVATAQTAANNAATALRNARMQMPPPPEIDQLTEESAVRNGELDLKRRELATAETERTNAENELRRREELLAESTRIRELIQANRDAALTQATASTAGTAELGSPTQRVQLDKAATEAIANSVTALVTEVLNKDYSSEACATLITSVNILGDKPTDDAKAALGTAQRYCLDLISAKTVAETARVSVVSFGRDPNSDRIQRALDDDPNFRPRLNTWLATNAPGTSVPALLNGNMNGALRARALSELGIR